MDIRRWRAAVTCPCCGKVWEERDARFCGRCGARLASGAESAATAAIAADDPPSGDPLPGGPPSGDPHRVDRVNRRGRPIAVLGGILLMALLGGPLVWSTVAGGSVEPSSRETDPRVELPDRDDLQAADASADASAVAFADASADLRSDAPAGQPRSSGTTHCDPQGCARWEVPLIRGASEVVGDVLVHATIGRRNSDQTPGGPSESTEVEVAAVDLMSGELRWQLPVPGTRSQVVAAAPATVHPIDEELVAVAVPSGLHVFDVADGRLHWSADVGVHVTDVHATADGNLIAWGRPQPRAVRIYGTSGVTAPVGPTAFLLGLDRDDGRLRWRQDDLAPLAWGPATVVAGGTDGRGLYGVDTATGELRWERRDLPEPRRVVRGDGMVAVHGDRMIELVDLASGETRLQLAIGVGAREVLGFVGSRLAVLGFGEAGDRALRLIDPAAPMTPGREFVGVTGVVSVQAEVERGSPRHPHVRPFLALTDQTATRLRLRVIDAEGTVRWEDARPLHDTACCYEVAATTDHTGIALLPPDPRAQPVEVLAVADGRLLRTVAAPIEVDDAVVRWVDELLMVERSDPQGLSTTFHGRAARLEVEGTAELVAVEPLPVVQTSTSLVGLEPEMFLGGDGRS